MHLSPDFEALIKQQFDANEAVELLESINSEPSTSVRVNRLKLALAGQSLICDNLVKVPWSSSGYYLNKRIKFTYDPCLHAGTYYVQEASSMFVEQALKGLLSKDVIALDLCAAPGGKSTLLRSIMSDESLLVSNEIVPKRAQILSENIKKWGHPNCIVTNNAPKDFTQFESLFDVILTDVPCSGEGMFRKDAVAIQEWSMSNVAVCKERQLCIIDDIWPSLKPGGVLVYSTCTFNRQENEDNIAAIIKKYHAETIRISIKDEWGVVESCTDGEFSYRFLPHKVKGEGLFMAVLRKPSYIGESKKCPILYNTKKQSKKGKKENPRFKKLLQECRNWILSPDVFDFKLYNDYIYAFNLEHMPCLELLQNKKVHILSAGISLAEIKGEKLIPQQGLAINALLNRSSFHIEEVSYEQAISYLRKEAITISAMAPKGYVIVSYKNYPLGFIKNLGNRSNNLYPNEWRIRSSYVTTNTEDYFL